MATPDKSVVLARIEMLHNALEQEPASPTVAQALHQCERLRQAVQQSHAEGLRFAAFTLTRLMQQTGAKLGDTTQEAARALKAGLDEEGYGV
jgi:hypothetical protein